MRFGSTYSAAKPRSNVYWLFVFFWLAGNLFGFALSNYYSAELLQRDFANGYGSFFGLFLSTAVPILLCALFAVYRLDFCAYAVCFLRALLQGFFLWSFSLCIGTPRYCLTGTFFLQCSCCTLMLFSFLYLRSVDRKQALAFIPSVVTVCLLLCMMIKLFQN